MDVFKTVRKFGLPLETLRDESQSKIGITPYSSNNRT